MIPLVTLFVLLVTGGTPAADSTITRVHAQAMTEKLALLEKRAKLGKARRDAPIAVSESEVSSYLNLSRGDEMPKELSDVVVRFQRDRVAARGLLDLDRLRRRAPVPKSLEGLLGFVSGRVPVEVAGRMRMVSVGVGAFSIEEAYLARVPIAPPLMKRLAVWATQSAARPEGYDIQAPFHFPPAVKRVRLEPGRALLD